MDIQLESIGNGQKGSFYLMVNPKLSDLFYWHFHPEYELVFIRHANGTRHVGDHISQYEGSDLVLIGSNIPHLNFDYGLKQPYEKIVVHFKTEFIDQHLQVVPELSSIAQLFKDSAHGIAFGRAQRQRIGDSLMNLAHISEQHLYLEIIRILQLLAMSEDQSFLHEAPFENQYSKKEQERLQQIYAYVDQHYHEKIELEKIAAVSNLSREAFCRYFKKVTGKTFIEFLNQYRISQSKRMLMAGLTISEACYRSGFESLSYFNRVFNRFNQENPRDFVKRFLNEVS